MFTKLVAPVPHPFYSLLPKAKEKTDSTYPTWETEGWKLYAAFQADTYLLRQYLGSTNPEFFIPCMGHNILSTPNTLYTVLIHPYIITVEVTQKFANLVDDLFYNTKSKNDLELNKVSELITSQSNIVFSIKHDVSKANSLQKKFLDFYGLTL